MKRILFLVSILAAGLMLCSSPAQATILEFDYGLVFSGDTPLGDAPWLVVTFDDLGSSGKVIMKIDTCGLGDADAQHLNGKGLYLNLNPNLKAESLKFNFLDNNDYDSTGPGATKILQGTDAYKADGDGLYDIELKWETGLNKLYAQNVVYYEILLQGLVAKDFEFLSAPKDGGSGPFYSAAKVQGIPNPADPKNTLSGWIAPGSAPVPEPATMLLMGAGLIGMAAFGRKKLFKK